jgi:hypothetical protein
MRSERVPAALAVSEALRPSRHTLAHRMQPSQTQHPRSDGACRAAGPRSPRDSVLAQIAFCHHPMREQ